MFQIAPELKLFRQCNQQFYRLFARGISKPCARSRRRRLVNHASYQANAFLAKALKKLSTDKFANMIVFLGWENGERTNNHVEVRFVDQKPTLHKVWGIGPEFKSVKALGLENLIPVSV